MSGVSETVLPHGCRLLTLAETGSTNSEALRLAGLGEPGGLWIRAERQTAGRGRSGRAWTSPPGNLAATLLLRPAAPVDRIAELALVAGVAVADAIRFLLPAGSNENVRVKWPNDVLIDRKKTAGILVETAGVGSSGGVAVAVGIGINVKSHPEETVRTATDLARHGSASDAVGTLTVLAETMDNWLAAWNDGAGFSVIRDAWLERALPVGEELSVHAGETLVIGRFQGLDTTGALLMTDSNGVTHRFTFGDVSLRNGNAL